MKKFFAGFCTLNVALGLSLVHVPVEDRCLIDFAWMRYTCGHLLVRELQGMSCNELYQLVVATYPDLGKGDASCTVAALRRMFRREGYKLNDEPYTV